MADACGLSAKLFSHGHMKTTGCGGPKLLCADEDKQGWPLRLPQPGRAHSSFLFRKSELKAGTVAQSVKGFAL